MYSIVLKEDIHREIQWLHIERYKLQYKMLDLPRKKANSVNL